MQSTSTKSYTLIGDAKTRQEKMHVVNFKWLDLFPAKFSLITHQNYVYIGDKKIAYTNLMSFKTKIIN